MRVKADYYSAETFDRPEVVQHVVGWCNKAEMQFKQNKQSAEFLIAKRIKSLCLKNYKLANGHTARFCEEWEKHPENMFSWIHAQFPSGKCKLVRHDKKADFEPTNITLKPQN